LRAFFRVEMRFDDNTYEHISRLLLKKNIPMREVHRQQAMMPVSARPIMNALGTAPGLWFEQDGRVYIAMPGVPFEMEEMMRNYILPALQNRFKGEEIIHRTLLTTGAGESQISEMISSWEASLPPHIKLAYLPQPGLIRLRLSGRGEERNELQRQIVMYAGQLEALLPQLVFGYNDDTLEELIGKYLAERNQTLSTAESCTGGYIAHLITSIPGSSRYYLGSIISYANHIKETALGVSSASLKEYGAVSEQVVTEMAKGVQSRFQSDYAIATSGIAGPDGGLPDKPVGTVWIAIASPSGIRTQKFGFSDNRMRNIRRTAVAALNLLREEIINGDS
jgi:nicotinamide-nucleotide amidase